nr:hypothetical protein Iba_chr02fCG10640 [Ipomoea batatas]
MASGEQQLSVVTGCQWLPHLSIVTVADDRLSMTSQRHLLIGWPSKGDEGRVEKCVFASGSPFKGEGLNNSKKYPSKGSQLNGNPAANMLSPVTLEGTGVRLVKGFRELGLRERGQREEKADIVNRY